jgi:hypothetical protein
MISGSLAKLKVPASVTRLDTLCFWDRASDSFPVSNEFQGRVYPADRFKTIYQRPTRRETLSIPSTQAINTSHLVLHRAMNEVFAVSEVPRWDSSSDTVYDTARALHRVTQGRVYREATQGTGDNLGALVRSDEGVLYGDLELRTEVRLPDAHREQYGDYFLTCPYDSALILQDGDYFSFEDGFYSGKEFRVREAYTEAGFQLARVESREKDVEDMVYELITAAGGYSATTGSVIPQTVSDRAFSGTVTNTETDSDGQTLAGKDITIYVYLEHVGFDFLIDGIIRRNGFRYKIYSTKIGADGEQWIIKALRTPNDGS